MLTLAVAATLIGFGLLVFALITANFWLAVACIVVCVVGLVILLIDTLRANRRGRSGVDDEPLFTIRGRESAVRSEPLLDDAEHGADAERAADDGRHDAPGLGVAGAAGAAGVAGLAYPGGDTETTGGPAVDGAGSDDPQATTAFAPVDGAEPAPEPAPTQQWQQPGPAASGLGSIVSPDAHGAPVGDVDDVRPGDTGPQEQSGDMNDYIRSVTGSFPAQPEAELPQAPLGGTESPTEGLDGGYTAVTGPVGERVRPEAQAATEPAGQQQATSTDSGHWPAADSPYVGRRRRAEDSDSVVVNSPDPTLPAMKLVYGDHADQVEEGTAAAPAPRRDTEDGPSNTDSDEGPQYR